MILRLRRSVIELVPAHELPDPDRIAVIHADRRWTAAEFRALISSWASVLSTDRPGNGIVGISLPHSPDAPAAMLGCLAAGNAFCAVDPDLPPAAKAAQLAKAEASILLCDVHEAEMLRNAGWKGRAVLREELPESSMASAPRPEWAPDNLVWLQFTSGSTGTPKAVAQTMASLAWCTGNFLKMLAMESRDRHVLLSPISAPPAPLQVFAALVTGAQLCLIEARKNSLAELLRFIRSNGITTMQTVPTLFRAMAAEVGSADGWPTLRAVKLGGEAATAANVRLFNRVAPHGAVLINGLGITEAGTNLCWHTHRAGQEVQGTTFPIGRPPGDIDLVIESTPGVPAAPGTRGEIVAYSSALPSGYWKDDERSTDVFGTRDGRRFLRTGDVGRWNADGLLEHSGRLDGMVKVRGNRVNPQEIRDALAAIDGVNDSAVVAETDTLTAYVEPRPGAQLHERSLRSRLESVFPPFMVPSAIIVLDKMPRTAGGKPDKSQLLRHEETFHREDDVIAPRNATESTLHALFSSVLPRRTFGVTDSFFDLGGDSLAATRLFSEIERVLGVVLPLVELSKHPSVEKLAVRIAESGEAAPGASVALLTPSPTPDARPLFAWPGGGMDVMNFMDLAVRLGPGVAFHAIPHRGVDGRPEYDLSLEPMAARGAELVRRVQPVGPYSLCGTSFGGRIALEVARMLRDAGQEVRYLAMLESYSPGYKKPRPGLTLKNRLRVLLRTLRPLNSQECADLRTYYLGIRQKWIFYSARRTVRKSRPGDPTLPMHKRYACLLQACMLAAKSHRPEPYDGPVHIYRAARQPPAELYQIDDTLGWHRWLTGQLFTEAVPGTHSTHLREPNAPFLAAAMLRDMKCHTGNR